VHGLQLWIALPLAHEDAEPAFEHTPSDAIPTVELERAHVRVLVGTAFGATSPVRSLADFVYADVVLEAGAEIELPSSHAERGAYVVAGAVCAGGAVHEPGRMLVFSPETKARVRAESASRVAFVAGAPLDAPRHIEWNFVSSDKARIEQAKDDWKNGRFPKVPGDEAEHIPLPE
jgi:redox-sensitive bicupin YhaK (pirin superfamily)